jgi:putative membrane protein
MVAVDQNSPLFWPMYTRMAASSDQFEIQSGQLALQMSQNPAVRQYAQMLIDHHQQTTAQLATAAQSAGLPVPPPAMTGAHAQLLANLRGAPMGSFDMAFRDAQIQAHTEALGAAPELCRQRRHPGAADRCRRCCAGHSAAPEHGLSRCAVTAPPMRRNVGERG